MTDIFRFLTIIVLLTISLTAFFLVLGAFFPKRVEKTQRIITQMPARAFGLGLVNFLFFGVILLVLFTITDGNANRVNSILRIILLIPTLSLTALLIAVLSFGLTGMINVLGERIFPDLSPLKKIILGSTVLSFACALPFVGWLILLPCIGFTGFGAAILGFFNTLPIKSDSPSG